MPRFIIVAQGCYVEIDTTTPNDVLGLCTFGIYSCCPIIIVNQNSGYVGLCHADDNTALENQVCGVPAWIISACPKGDYHNLQIYVGEEQDSEYFMQVQRSIEAVITDSSNRPTIRYTPTRAFIINRAGIIIPSTEGGITQLDVEDLIGDHYTRDDITLDPITLPSLEYEEGRDIGGCISTARDRAIKKYGGEVKSPICIFRGADFLKLDEMQKENPSIKFGRVIKNKTLDTDSDSSDNRTSHFGELELNALLKFRELYVVESGSGGDCFFHAIARQLEKINNNRIMTHEELRQFAVNYMLNHPNRFEGFTVTTLDNYISEMSQQGMWADNPIIQALVNELGISIQVYRADGTITILTPVNNDALRTVSIAYTGNHYLSVESIHTENLEEIENWIAETIEIAENSTEAEQVAIDNACLGLTPDLDSK
jgi:hypothetical protein